MKYVIQLDNNNYFVGLTVADESPLEPGVYLLPAGTIEADVPNIPNNYIAKWNGCWVFEAIPVPEPELISDPDPVLITYIEKRIVAYPSIQDQLDMQYWDNINGTTNWLDTITSVKAEYPKMVLSANNSGTKQTAQL